jgi:hypothetical protein
LEACKNTAFFLKLVLRMINLHPFHQFYH